MTSAPRLAALLDGRLVGHVFQERTGRFRCVYDDAWRESDDAYPLSLSLPLAAAEHGHEPVNAFLWGLLPDNTQILTRWARTFSVSSGNPISLLVHVGADCAGAVQLIPPERVDEFLGVATGKPAVDWISEADVAQRLRDLRTMAIPRLGGTRHAGQFSLAGAQPKIALLMENGRWGVPFGRTPTNQILKPPATEYHAFAENEHLCLDLAQSLGLGATRSQVMRFEHAQGSEVAIVVKRFDREKVGNRYIRVHQEDCCQALGLTPQYRYESDGGPGAARIFALIREASDQPALDASRFIDALALNWIIAAPDAHAKNFALLHASGRRVRLAPFYDIASYLPYDPGLRHVKLAMRLGGEYRVRRVVRRHWEAFEQELGFDAGVIVHRVRAVAERVPDTVHDVGRTAEADGLAAGAIRPLVDGIAERARACANSLR